MAVHDTGSITLAGKQVGRTQPAITHQMHRLERALGRPLFDGERRHGALTRDGEVLLAYARKLLTLNDEIRDRFQGPDIAGRVRLGVPDLYAAAFLLPSVLAASQGSIRRWRSSCAARAATNCARHSRVKRSISP